MYLSEKSFLQAAGSTTANQINLLRFIPLGEYEFCELKFITKIHHNID